ncbi:hypothetical protein Y032_0535g3077 [Ancylostoma ceylanicum]|uniref:Uncharacterized protein n=1 Tax=Ancylostoma ceylanicum TaxID=53326 RepID=A0A016WRM4_9BILA|nr:hypothetical protein Y032_0535g3077 [Ancylostoma ceylanicum]
MFRSTTLIAVFVALNTCYAAPSANADAAAAIPGIGNLAGNVAAALPDVRTTPLPYFSIHYCPNPTVQLMGTVDNVVDTASGAVNNVVDTAGGAVNNLAGTATGIAGQLPIAGPIIQQLLGTVSCAVLFNAIYCYYSLAYIQVLGLLGVVLGIAHQIPMPNASASIQAST